MQFQSVSSHQVGGGGRTRLISACLDRTLTAGCVLTALQRLRWQARIGPRCWLRRAQCGIQASRRTFTSASAKGAFHFRWRRPEAAPALGRRLALQGTLDVKGSDMRSRGHSPDLRFGTNKQTVSKLRSQPFFGQATRALRLRRNQHLLISTSETCCKLKQPINRHQNTAAWKICFEWKAEGRFGIEARLFFQPQGTIAHGTLGQCSTNGCKICRARA